MFLFYIATGVASMVLFGQATNGAQGTAAMLAHRPACDNREADRRPGEPASHKWRQLGGCRMQKTALPAAAAPPPFQIMLSGLTARSLWLLVQKTLAVVYSGLSGTRHYFS
jgi:hypothetical protein